MRKLRVNVLEISPIFTFPVISSGFLDEIELLSLDCKDELNFDAIGRFYASMGLEISNILKHEKDYLNFPNRNDIIFSMSPRGDLIHRLGGSININYSAIRDIKVRSGICGNYVIGYPHPLHLRALIDRWHAIEPGQAPHPWAYAILRFLLLMMIHPFEDGNGRAARAVLDHEVSLLSGEASPSLGLSPFIHARMGELVRSTVESQRTGSNLALFEWFRLVLTDRIAYDNWARRSERASPCSRP